MTNNILDRLQDAYDISIEAATTLSTVLEELMSSDKSLSQLTGDRRLGDLSVTEKIKLSTAILRIASLVEDKSNE